MKKILAILILLFFVIVANTYLLVNNIVNERKQIEMENSEYAEYLTRNIYGTELATLINKTIDKNENNNIAKDKNNYYIENDINSLKIEIKMKITKKTYAMEEIYNNDITEFIKYFNFADFKCTNIEYHEKTGRISKLLFEEI